MQWVGLQAVGIMVLLVIISKEMELNFLLSDYHALHNRSSKRHSWGLMHKTTLSLKCDLYTQGGLDIEFGDQDRLLV